MPSTGNEALVVRSTLPTPIGELLVFTQGETILAIEFRDRGHAEARLRRFLPDPIFVVGEMPTDAGNALSDYFASACCAAFHCLSLQPFGSEFQRHVWDALRMIPAGETLSYGDLAKRIGRPGASRAVGAANGQNPIPIIIPCHRVVGSDGTLTGYGSGVDRKAWLLRHEGVGSNGGTIPQAGKALDWPILRLRTNIRWE